jgi:hypothetical protein
MKKMLVLFTMLCLALAGCGPARALVGASQPGEDPIAGGVFQTAATLPTPAATAPATATTAPVQPAVQVPTATQPQPQPAMNGLIFPIRAAFYYPWFPNSWNQQGMNPFTHYNPSLGFYSQDDPAIISEQIAAMQYGKIQLGISSWWGQGNYTDKRFATLLQAGEKVGFYWVAYMESEGQGNPSVAAISSDLQYIHDKYASSPAYLKIGGRFVVFVYAEPGDDCGMVDRWTQANTLKAYLILKIFSRYQKCPNQPDAWHEYAPASPEKRVGIESFTISPGFFKASEPQPRLGRDLQQWDADIQAMLASKANFELITTFNEWGEGTAVESAKQWANPSGFGEYLDALHYDGNPPASLAPPGN